MKDFHERAEHCSNPAAKKLFRLMAAKQTNLALSADVTQAEALLQMANDIGPDICVLKTHIDIMADFTSSVTEELQQLARQHQFLIFEDRKFADIGNTVKQQYAGGLYRIADWADMINAHCLPGPGIISGLAEAGLKKNRGLLLLAQMSSENNLLDAAYTQKTLAFAEQFPGFVMGFIAQQKLSDNPAWIYMTPGIQMSAGGDALGQQYVTPEQAILKNGTDIIIVGRGILNASMPVQTAREYREAGWAAYQKSLSKLPA